MIAKQCAGRLVVACVLSLAFIPPHDGAVDLHKFIHLHIQLLNLTETLTEDVQFVAETSSKLLKARRRARDGLLPTVDKLLLQPLSATDSVQDVLQAVFSSLEAVERYAEEDSFLTVFFRRICMARFVLMYLGPGQPTLSIEEEQALFDIMKILYHAHVSSVVRRGLMEHTHISKSGGSSFSIVADMNNCRKYHGLGQPSFLGDGPHWVNKTALIAHSGVWCKRGFMHFGVAERRSEYKTCEQRVQAVLDHGWQYVSNEYTPVGGLHDMRATHLCPQYVNVVTMRNPEKRLISNIHYMMSMLVTDFRSVYTSTPKLFNQIFCSNSNFSVWYEAATPVVDNYMTRSFLGERGFNTPLGGLNQEHVAVARQLLLHYDMIVDLDAGPHAVHEAMAQGLGWNVTISDVQARKGQSFDVDAEGCRNEELIQELLPRQEPDRQLFRVGRAISFLDSLLFSLARNLGLRPHPHGLGSQAGTGFDTSLDMDRYPCGLLGFREQS